MATEIFSSDRNFRNWGYTVSLTQLLLRTVKTDKHATRIDILFQFVWAINMRTSLQGISITEEADEERVNQLLPKCPPDGAKRKIFVVRSSNSVGYVIAGMVGSHEDTGHYNDPSPFDFFCFPPNNVVDR